MIKICEHCNNNYNTYDYKQKCCSKSCSNKYTNSIKSVCLDHSTREDIFRQKFNFKFKGYEYISGYTHCDCNVYIKCLQCNNIFKISAQSARKKYYKIECKECRHIAMGLKKADMELKKIEIKLKKIEIKKIKELSRIQSNTIEKLCMACCKPYKTTRNKAKFCSVLCCNKYHNKKHDMLRNTKLRYNGAIDNDIYLEKVIRKYNNICSICGKEVDLNDCYHDIYNNFIVGRNYPSIDHVIPISKGGKHIWDNIQLAHMICNIKKSNKV
jgi:hypothetical protein